MLLRLLVVGSVLTCLWTAASAAERPVLVELFTSEGGSSRPPADAPLTGLAHGRHDGLPLAFHVTCWDRLGWRDADPLAAATSRQGAYGSRFGDGSSTPEMVVDGTTAFVVGSERTQAGGAIASAGRQSRTATAIASSRQGGRVPIPLGAGAPLRIDEAAPVGQDAAVLLEAPDGAIVGAVRL